MDIRRARLACWNMRLAGLFAAGPVAGLVLLALTFGMTIGMKLMAFVMAIFSLVLFGILLKAEYDQLTRQ